MCVVDCDVLKIISHVWLVLVKHACFLNTMKTWPFQLESNCSPFDIMNANKRVVKVTTKAVNITAQK